MTQLETPEQLTQPPAEDAAPPAVYALLAEFDDVDTVFAAVRRIRSAGYERFDVHSPFPIHGLDDVMGVKTTILPWIVLAGGLAGMFLGLGMLIHTMGEGLIPPELLITNLEGYPYLISGKPFNSMPAWIPITFEMTILLSSLAAGAGMLILNKLPLLSNPLLRNDRFRRVTDDRLFITIQARDPRFDLDQTRRLLHEHGATAVEIVEE